MKTKYTIGIDVGEAEGDKTIIAHALRGKNGITKIWFDEYANFPVWKWYRNPIKWWWWRRVTKKWQRDSKFFELRSTPPANNKFRDLVEGRWKK